MNTLKFKLFLLAKLPIAYLAGLKLEQSSDEKASISIKYKFLTQNPFRSIYFACLAMAAELATGLLALLHIEKSKASISILVVGMHASFHKKAVGKITFTSEDGKKMEQTIQEAIKDGEGKQVEMRSVGKNEQGEIVAEFVFNWSLKVRKATN